MKKHSLPRYGWAVLFLLKNKEEDDRIGPVSPRQVNDFDGLKEVVVLSKIDKKKLDRLYGLLREAEKGDLDTAAALRWAIFTLEQADRQDKDDDFFRLVLMPEQTLNSIIDSGAFNEVIKGYLVAAMQTMDFDCTSIQKTVNTLDYIFDEVDADAARKSYRKLWI